MIDLAKKYKHSAIKRVNDSELSEERKKAYGVLINTCDDDLFTSIVGLFEFETSILRKMERAVR